jgi:hypothetical protein
MAAAAAIAMTIVAAFDPVTKTRLPETLLEVVLMLFPCKAVESGR